MNFNITNNNIDSSIKGDNKKNTNANNNTKSKNSNIDSSKLGGDTLKTNKDKIEEKEEKYIDMNVKFKKFLHLML